MNPKIGPLEEGPPSRFRTPKKYSFKTELEGLKMKKNTTSISVDKRNAFWRISLTRTSATSFFL
jgi:hypothetical protein